MINLTNDTIKFSLPIMNDRIKELESQCWETQQLSADANSWHTSFNSRKFAELIIMDCISKCEFVADMATITNKGEMARKTKATADSCAKMIKEHFGVEE